MDMLVKTPEEILMKFAFVICFIILAGILGFIIEPTLRPHLTGKPPTPGSTASTPPAITSAEAKAIIGIIKSSIANQEIKAFSSDQVTDWKAGVVESYGGKEYRTGIASYSMKTPFGKTTLKAKALIQNEKVERWVWPNTKIELQ